MPSLKKCQAEQLADTNQVGSDFRRQPDTFDNPVHVLVHWDGKCRDIYLIISLCINPEGDGFGIYQMKK